MNKTILIPLPLTDFDPSEVSVPWKILTENNIRVVFATPQGKVGACDPLMITGEGLGPLGGILRADKVSRANYAQLSQAAEFLNPISWDDIRESDYQGLIIPGGHAKGMRPYLESEQMKNVVAAFFEKNKPVASVCHGVLLVARTKGKDGRSVLFKRKTTGLLKTQELLAWNLTRFWKGDYYLTYDMRTQDEIESFLENRNQFIEGPLPLTRDNPTNLKPGFFVRDGNFVSARWPGDVHSWSYEFLKMLE